MNVRRKALSTLLPACALALSLATLMSAAASQDGQMQSRKSLYERLGGYNAVAAVVDDFVGRLVTDKQFERFFAGHSTDSKKRIRQPIVEQLCAAAGGPCVYTGRSMEDSHQGLGISEAEWDAAAKHLVASLDKFKVPEAEKKDLLAFVTSVKPDIVEKKRGGGRR
ncbi:MAG: group 1 truncated hemoglobin [Pyrinomonadaceae bacterium]